MSVIKDYNGNDVEAFDLIMTKANAWDIINGKKCLEVRSLSPFYIKRFLKPKRSLAMTVDAFETKDVHAIHFHDYGNTWYLDCNLYGITVVSTHPDSREFFYRLNFHDFDELIDENERKGLKEEETNCCFGLVIDGIHGTNLCTPDKIIATGGKLGHIAALDEILNY